ncbi:aminopeptidase N [Biformimicrobium ophioploci]|uniref:Aminopeptidase N n=1 Tax=Biformimicrobium ophioploci TaxID=3036711 RepID=A0ABQ6LXT5_9GAMM|nr:aminopeptidase N [Microbulbifer sp. NKW57]GMG86908.1 aminopeptidase N [Microbulbifer sp. NKW57]
MKDAQPRTIYLKDYRAPDYWIDETHLTFDLQPDATLVESRLKVRRNLDQGNDLPKLVLDGVELELVSVAIDGQSLSADEYVLYDESLELPVSRPAFELQILTRIKPESNTSLEGLYLSNGMYCTQCEAEGFRKITFYPDRPDVMSRFTTKVIAPRSYPVLLSNGNDIERGELDNDRHFVTWQDPFPKPSYLFALVAGDLEHVDETFTTKNGREVKLQLFTEPRNIHKCDHAMRSLKHSMRWDEEVYGREYDLDIFMIVAVDHFNMGAMENKGLNIFNSSCVLASPETATDAAFQRIEAIVGHEYFHNWSGNRVTCRDWFQLSLKEGFTVFRDAEFSADMNSAAVKRIEDVVLLRASQFAEDAGPMAHPIRPESYMEISNFYTLTVYEKGAEVVRMIHNIVGKEAFRKGSDLYFDRHDGQAATCEDFVAAMEEASGKDLEQFRNWYNQAGTPLLEVSDSFDEQKSEYHLHVKQSCPPTPGQKEKQPFHIPFAIGLLDSAGKDIPLNAQGDTQLVLDVTQTEQTFSFDGVGERPLPSLLRGFSAPVKLRYDYSAEQLAFLMSHDSDGFNRWDAGQRLALLVLEDLQAAYRAGEQLVLDTRLADAYRAVLEADDLDLAVRAKMLELPAEQIIAESSDAIDAEAIIAARSFLKQALAEALEPQLSNWYTRLDVEKPYSPSSADIAERSLKNTCLAYLVLLQKPEYRTLANKQFAQSGNMTDCAAALAALVNSGDEVLSRSALDAFYEKWQEDPLVFDQWLAIQAGSARFGTLQRVRDLLEHPAFELTSPNKVRSVVGAFAMRNFTQFHAGEGEGFDFLADFVIRLDKVNPQIAARLVTPITRWRKYQSPMQEFMHASLARVMAAGNLSKDLYEVVSKGLA